MTMPNSDATPMARAATRFSSVPAAFGLYDPRFEHDACGVSFICDIKGRASRSIVTDALDALCNLDHRGASGAEVNTGDGAGILLQVPDRFFRAVVDFPLPPAGAYGVGLAFLPLDAEAAEKTMNRINAIVEDEGLRVVGWREVPVDTSMIGPTALSVVPSFQQRVRRRPRRRHRPRARPAALRRAEALRARARGARRSGRRRRGGLLPVAVEPDPRLQGHAHHAPAPRVLPRPRRRPGRVRAGAGAQPLLHQHVPVVAARAPVPVPGPQRRDQHRAGQPQLDARPRGVDVDPADPASRACLPDHHARRVRHRDLRRVPRAAAPRRPPASGTRRS